MNADAIDYVLRQYLKIERCVRQFTFPIFLKLSEKRYVLYGSCVGIQRAGRKYILTASHLIHEFEVGSNVVIGLGGSFLQIDLLLAVHLSNSSFDIDVCVIEMENAPESMNFWMSYNCYIGDNVYKQSKQYMQGFPTSKNKYSDMHDDINLALRTGFISLGVKIDQYINHSFKKISDTSHWLFNYQDGRSTTDPSEAIATAFNKNNAISLRGLSGCGLWSIHDISLPSTLRLAGIFISHQKSGAGAATKISKIISYIS
jgi:hypothetical protein